MRVQWKTWSAIVVGAALMGGGCGPSGQSEAAQSQNQSGATFCGGIANRPCPDGLRCVDDPADDCDPNHGGADCGGICVRPEDSAQNTCGHEPGYRYLLRDPAKCAAVRFTCPTGQEPFFNECGCGCRPVS
jgi:hypothetical protein